MSLKFQKKTVIRGLPADNWALAFTGQFWRSCSSAVKTCYRFKKLWSLDKDVIIKRCIMILDTSSLMTATDLTFKHLHVQSKLCHAHWTICGVPLSCAKGYCCSTGSLLNIWTIAVIINCSYWFQGIGVNTFVEETWSKFEYYWIFQRNFTFVEKKNNSLEIR